jgi:tRNA(fMet)-specific endonuclease VapC
MLDTNIASYAIKGHDEGVVARLMNTPPDLVCISVMTRAELLYGLKRLRPQHGLHVAVRQFLKLVLTVAWDEDAAEHYANLRHELIGRGQPIGDLDMMIAASALSTGMVLVTNNLKHFKRIRAPLRLENWATGSAHGS